MGMWLLIDCQLFTIEEGLENDPLKCLIFITRPFYLAKR